MTFKQIGPNKVQGDEGFVFWMKNPFQLHYIETDHEIIVPGEILTGESELLVSVSTIKKWMPPHDEAIDEAKKKQIVSNIAGALSFMGIRYEFD